MDNNGNNNMRNQGRTREFVRGGAQKYKQKNRYGSERTAKFFLSLVVHLDLFDNYPRMLFTWVYNQGSITIIIIKFKDERNFQNAKYANSKKKFSVSYVCF